MDTPNRSMATQAVLLADGLIGDNLAALERILAAETLLPQRVPDVAAAIDALVALVEAGTPALLVLIGPGVANPLGAARRMHHASPLSHLVLLADEAHADELRGAASPFAMLGTQWSIAHFGAADLAGVIGNAARAARRRQRLRTTLAHINVQLAGTPAARDSGQALVTPDRFLASVLAHAYDAIIATTNDGTITVWNRAAEQLFGVSETHAIGTPIRDVAGGAWRTEVPALLARIDSDHPPVGRHQLHCVRADGSTFDTELVMTPVRDDLGRHIGVSAILRDVTHSKRTEAALGASQRLLEAITDTSTAVIYVKDLHGRYLFVNRRFENLFGVSRATVHGKTDFDIFPAAQAKAFRTFDQEVIDAGRELSAEELAPHADGLHTYLSIKAPLYDASGQPYAICGISTDITERKRLEERVRATVESAPFAMVMTDHDGTIQLVNTGAEKLFGYARAELLGRPVEILVPARVRSPHADMRHGYFARPEARRMGAGRDLYAVRKDGSEFPVEIGLNPITTEEGTFVLSAIVDITERKRAAEALGNSEERLRRILDTSLDAVVTIDEADRVTGWNAQAEKIFGWRRDEALGQILAELIIPPSFRAAHVRGLAHFLRTGEGPVLNRRLELTAMRRNGDEFPVELAIAPLRLNDRYEFSAFVRDITERKALEAAMRDMNQELERRVERRTGELARANDALERSNLELQQFAYIASHDLQSPLRSISGFVQLLQEDYGGQLDDRAQSWIRRVVENVQRMQTLIRDLLAYSRVESRARPFEPTDMQEVFDDAVAALDTSIRDAGAKVTRDALPVVTGDRSHLVQLLQNLIDNGIKYHADAPPEVHVSAERQGMSWLFSVRDNGIGIPLKHRERVFELFHRLHTQQTYPGTGIGLAICRRVVLRHGGKIWVDPEPGAGSTFRFTLPATSP